MEINHTEASEELSGRATEWTAAVVERNEGHGPEGSLPQQICFVEDHGSEGDIMELRKQTGEVIKHVHKRSEVSASAAAEQGDYIVRSILSVVYSDAFDVGVIRAYIRKASNCKLVTKFSECKAIVKNGLEDVEYNCKEPSSDRVAWSSEKINRR